MKGSSDLMDGAPPSEIVAHLYKHASRSDFTKPEGMEILTTLLDGEFGNDGVSNNILTEVESMTSTLTDIEIVRLCWALGSCGIHAVTLENFSVWHIIEERISMIEFDSSRLRSEMARHDEFLFSMGFNRSSTMISSSPLVELLLGLYKMDLTWGKLTKATRYALCTAIWNEIEVTTSTNPVYIYLNNINAYHPQLISYSNTPFRAQPQCRLKHQDEILLPPKGTADTISFS